MTAVVLAGGKGTRLRPLTVTVPKPLLPLGEVPIIEVVIGQLVRAGVARIIVAVGHMADLLTAVLGDGRRWGVSIEYFRETSPLGTAGALRALAPSLRSDFFVLNGDILTTLDFNELYALHVGRRAAATIAAKVRQVHIDFGVVYRGADGRLDRFDEKPTMSYLVSMGVNILSPRALSTIPQEGCFDMPDLLKALRRQGENVQVFETECYWCDIGRLDDYNQATADFLADPDMFLSQVR